MLVLLNPAAGGGRATRQWDSVRAELERDLGCFELLRTGNGRVTRDGIAAALRRGERRFVAAGGDGTVNCLIGTLASLAAPSLVSQLCVGAVGLGSSNDFHKPFRNGARNGGVPRRLDFAAAIPHDIGVLQYIDATGAAYRRYWVNNASMGVTADGNHRFNAPDLVLGWLKRTATGPAITYAAVRALLAHQARSLTLKPDDGPAVTLRVANLGVVKNPHFAGSLRYDSPRDPSGGRFYVHVLEGQSRRRLLLALFNLFRGRFMGRERTHSWRVARLSVEAEEPLAIEIDGEVVVALRACFALLPQCLSVCP